MSGCHLINSLMHYSCLHSINKAIFSSLSFRDVKQRTSDFVFSYSVVFLVAFPQNAFNSILFQFNCHIAAVVVAAAAAFAIAYVVYMGLPISVDQFDTMTGTWDSNWEWEWEFEWEWASEKANTTVQLAVLIISTRCRYYTIFLRWYMHGQQQFCNGFRFLRLRLKFYFYEFPINNAKWNGWHAFDWQLNYFSYSFFSTIYACYSCSGIQIDCKEPLNLIQLEWPIKYVCVNNIK